MSTVFLLCAVAGGTVLVFQFVMSVIGLGDSGLELADDLPDGAELEAAEAIHADVGDLESGEHVGSTWMFGIVSFRTIVAAITFFGLTGLLAESTGLNLPMQLVIAVLCAGAAMIGVHRLVQAFYGLGQSGTLRVSNAVGKTATVYIPIPAGKSGQGKVQVEVQDRLEEFTAVTSAEDKLATGARVVVTKVIGGSTLEVEPLPEGAKATA